MTQWLQWQNKEVQSDPITVGKHTLTLQSKALHIQFPYGGFVWHRPTSIYVNDGSNFTKHSIIDVTRSAQWRLVGFGILFAVLTLLITAQSQPTND